jgi:hypothetical protein
MYPRLLVKLAPLFCFATLASAQWLDYPTPDVPHSAHGKPYLNAAAPRTAGGKPNFSGMWG